MGNYLLSNRGEGWPCGVSHLRPSSEKSIGTRSVRELGRLRRASTVEIHGRDIVGGIRRGANFVSRRTSLAAFLGKKSYAGSALLLLRFGGSETAGAFAMQNDKWDREEAISGREESLGYL